MLETSNTSQIKVREEHRGASSKVAFVSLDNARKINTLNSPLMLELIREINRVGSDDQTRAVVLTGEGEKAFIGGANIDEMLTFDVPAARAYITLCHQTCNAMRACPVPVIARIQGFAIGAGVEIAASCDLRIASENAKFAMPEVKLGVPSVIEAALLPSLIGWGRAREVMLLGETFSAQEAFAWGLVERLVPANQLDAGVEQWLESILKTEPRSVRMQKRLMQEWEDLPLKGAIRRGIDCFAEAWEHEAPGKAMRQFVEAENSRKAAKAKAART